MLLSGKVAVVTGGARGLGREIALRFVREGAAVALGDILTEGINQTADEIRVAGGDAIAVVADVGNPEHVARLFLETRKRFERIDVLVNNAGIAPNRLLLDQSLDEWERVLRTNLTGAFLCAKTAVPLMEEADGGAIVNIASISGQRGATGRSAYGVSKAGLIQLTRLMAVEFAPRIRVNAIAPGPIRTDITNHSAGTEAAYLSRIPMARYGSADAVAAAAAYLASDEASYTTGHVLNVDGGFDAAGLMFAKDEIRDPGGE